MAKIKTNKHAIEVLDQDQMDGVSSVLSSHATWQDLGGPSLIQQLQLNHNNLHFCTPFDGYA